jgi:hypothetical protein
MKSGERPVSSIIALVMDAGVGQPVGVFGFEGMLVMDPCAISSASRMGVYSVFSGVGPAPDIPGTVESRVLERMLQNKGRSGRISGFVETNAMRIFPDPSNFAEHQSIPGAVGPVDGEVVAGITVRDIPAGAVFGNPVPERCTTGERSLS